MTAPVAARSNQRALVMLGAGVGVLVLFLLVTKLLGGGGGSDLSAPITVPPRPGGSLRTTTTTVPPPADATFEVFSNKNPFVPLAATGTGTGTGSGSTGGTGTAPPPGSGTAVGTSPPGSGSPSGSGTSSGGTSTEGTSTDGTSSTSTTTPAGTGGQQPRTGQRVALLDVFDDAGTPAANVRVNDTVYERLHAGDEFATSFKVVALDGQCGTFLYGDDRFRLCTGDEVLK